MGGAVVVCHDPGDAEKAQQERETIGIPTRARTNIREDKARTAQFVPSYAEEGDADADGSEDINRCKPTDE